MVVAPELREALWATAVDLADIAASRCLPLFRSSGLATTNKAASGFDPVTEADRASEQAMRALLAERRPEDGVLGEEFGHTSGRSGLTWVLDPIDGTRAFVSGAPTWGILIGLDAGEGPILGVVDQPFTRERFIGGFGRAEYRRDGVAAPMRVRPCAGLAEAVLYTTRPEIGSPEERAGFDAVRDRVRLTRYGFDCYAYAMVALGHVDLVIEAAGGIVTNWHGGPAHGGGRVIAAGDARVHAAALEILAKVPG